MSELSNERNQVLSQAESILDACDQSDRAMTASEERRFESCLKKSNYLP